MSVASIIYLVVLLFVLLGGFIFFIFMDLKKHGVSRDKNNPKAKKTKNTTEPEPD